jgi:hypothetical protein
MLKSRCFFVALCAACITLALLVPTALAAGPASVTVRVEGLTETKLLPTQVTTSSTPVVKDGKSADACPGTSAAGALELATGGNWGGPWSSSFNQYEIFSIEGEEHVFEKGAAANYFWSFWLNEKESEVGACGVELQPGDRVLFFPSCYGTACPPAAPTPLGIESPSSANVGEAVPVTVKQFSSSGAASPLGGASVTGGARAETTDSGGHAVLTFSSPGEVLIRASAPASVRTETSICVHAGNDGTCGTQRAPSTGAGTSSTPSGLPGGRSSLVPALAGHVSGVLEGHVYRAASAPRLLAGSVLAHAAVSSVSLELHRSYKGRCSAYDAVKERFVPARCGHGRFFKVSSDGVFSYLLPGALGPGRYVLDLEASDAAGEHTTLVRGATRFVFYVR